MTITRVPFQIPLLDPQTSRQGCQQVHHSPSRCPAEPHPRAHQVDQRKDQHHQGTKQRIHLGERQEGLVLYVTELRELRTPKKQLTTFSTCTVVTQWSFSFPRTSRSIATWSRTVCITTPKLWNGRDWDRNCPVRTLQCEDGENVLGTGDFLRGVPHSPNPILESHKDGFHFHGNPPVSDMLECGLLRR